jgi:prepilin-type N-terminal cleavage/methylation domain-containing protein
MRRGFTIIELSFVIAIMAILVAITVPNYQVLVHRARADEARAMVYAIGHAELRYRRDHGRFLACEAQEPVPRGPVSFPNDRPCWKALGVQVDGQVRYRYRVSLDADSFVVVAEGDLDADGLPSQFSLNGRDFQLTVKDENE